MKESMNCQVDLEILKQRADKLDGENSKIMMMSAVDCVVQLAEDSGFSEDFLTIADKYVNSSQKYRPSFLPCSSNGVPREQGQAFLRLLNIWVAAM